MKKLLIVIFIILCIAVTIPTTITAFAETSTIFSCDDFDVYAPASKSGNTVFSVDIKGQCDEYPLEDCFRLYLKGSLDGGDKVFYTDGDQKETYQARKDGNTFYLYLRYNEIYTLTIEKDGEKTTKTMDLSSGFFDFKAPKISNIGKITSDSSVKITITDNTSGAKHISLKSGIKKIRFYSDSLLINTEEEYASGKLNVEYTAKGLLKKNGTTFYIEVTDVAGNTTTEVVYTLSSWNNEYKEKLSVVDNYISYTDSSGIGLSYSILEDLEDVRQRYIDEVMESGNALSMSDGLKTDWERAVKSASTALSYPLTRQVDYDIPDGTRLKYLEGSAYFDSLRYGDEIKIVIKREEMPLSNYDGVVPYPTSQIDSVIIYKITVTKNGQELAPTTPITLLDDGKDVFENESVKTVGKTTSITFNSSEIAVFTKKPSTLDYRIVIGATCGLFLIIAVYTVLAMIRHKKRQNNLR